MSRNSLRTFITEPSRSRSVRAQHPKYRGLTSNDCARESVSTIQSDAVTTSRSVDLNLSGVWRETLCRIFSCDTALDSKSTSRDAVLGKSKLSQSGTCSDLDLSSNEINASDLLGNCVLDLNTGVDLDEVVSVLLINQEFRCSSIAVID